jgi:hypothetical protein
MGDLDRRLFDLERSFAESGGGYEDTESKRFVVASLHAMMHIRRAPVDDMRWRYDVRKLRGRGPSSVAAYAAALRVLAHPDEEEAFGILTEERGDGDPVRYEELMGLVAAIAAQSRLRHQGERWGA